LVVDVGILVKQRYRADPDWYEYRISENAQSIVPALVAIAAPDPSDFTYGTRPPN
jgi:hypothetical protein